MDPRTIGELMRVAPPAGGSQHDYPPGSMQAPTSASSGYWSSDHRSSQESPTAQSGVAELHSEVQQASSEHPGRLSASTHSSIGPHVVPAQSDGPKNAADALSRQVNDAPTWVHCSSSAQSAASGLQPGRQTASEFSA